MTEAGRLASPNRHPINSIGIKRDKFVRWVVSTGCALLFLDSPGFSRAGYNQENEQAPSLDMSPVLRERCLVQGARWERQTARLIRASFPTLTFFGTTSIRARLRGSFASFSQPR